MRSTTRPPPPPGRSTPWRPRARTLLSSFTRLADEEISPRQLAALDALRREVKPAAAAASPLALADQEDALSAWLTSHGVDHEWAIAPPLAAAGIDLAWCERAGQLLEGAALEPGLEWVASTFSVASLLSDIKESSRRISELVAAVKSYSHMDRASLQRISVTDGLESTLVMLGHKLRGGVTVVRDYGADVPEIEAYPGELNQVWTNLIDNAIDAMDGAGTLRITTRAEGNEVWSRSVTPALACHRRWPPAHSMPSTRPRTSGRAPGSVSTSPSASW